MYKFSIGQSVKVKREDRWVGDYEVPAVIIGLGNVFMNGIPSYNLKTCNNEMLIEICENKIVP
jgi:hypothetical protein